jgi:hypothetical protein
VSLPRPSDEAEELAWRLHHDQISWLDAMEAQLQAYRRAGRIRDAAVVARMGALVFPGERATNYSAGMLYLELGRAASATARRRNAECGA